MTRKKVYILISIAICDDESYMLNHLKENIELYMKQNNLSYNIELLIKQKIYYAIMKSLILYF